MCRVIHRHFLLTKRFQQDHLIVPTTYNCPLYDSFWAAITRPHVLIREIYRYAWKGCGSFLGTLVEAEFFGISSLIAEDGTPIPHSKEREDRTNPENLPDFAVLSVSPSTVSRWSDAYQATPRRPRLVTRAATAPTFGRAFTA
jgi:hypothetical protein